MIIVATAKIYDLKENKYVKETKDGQGQFLISDKNSATEFNIFQANNYVTMIPGEQYALAAIKIKKYEVEKWLKSMAK